jgi:hypothetical protein
MFFIIVSYKLARTSFMCYPIAKPLLFFQSNIKLKLTCLYSRCLKTSPCLSEKFVACSQQLSEAQLEIAQRQDELLSLE